MPQTRHTVFIIDDDASVRRSLGRVMTSAGFDSKAFASVDEFLAGASLHAKGCIVADMTMLGISSLDLRQVLKGADSALPVIFVTAQDTEEARGAAREAGAAGFFRKPVDTQALLDAIQWTFDNPRLAKSA
ncbi:MAG: response regulator [Verrucomicrobia bacterium]|nr:response regulator [Verrucomicrobiota bacterium]